MQNKINLLLYIIKNFLIATMIGVGCYLFCTNLLLCLIFYICLIAYVKIKIKLVKKLNYIRKEN